MTNTPEFWIWRTMKSRCSNPNSSSYHRYGGRGIKVCLRWQKSFHNFIQDMGRRPSNGHQLERKHNDRGYTPDNCVWATLTEQCNNRSTNVWFTFNGETKTASQWNNQLGLNRAGVQKRLKAGWSEFKTFTTHALPRTQRKRFNPK